MEKLTRQVAKPKIIRKIREQATLTRGVFAKMLEISENYLYRLESGIRKPGLKLLKKVAQTCGVPFEELLDVANEPDEAEAERLCEVARMFIKAVLKTRSEHRSRLDLEERYAKLEYKLGHFAVLIHFHLQFEEIICNESLTKKEKLQEMEKLAKATAEQGEIAFSEMLIVFRVKRAVLKEWVAAAVRVYKCLLVEDREVNACTPGEAALRLCCFECEYLEKGQCAGFGNEQRPENIIELLERLSENGIYKRDEQSKVLEESYGIKLSEHQISEIVYRDKKGQKIPESAFNLEGSNGMGKNEI